METIFFLFHQNNGNRTWFRFQISVKLCVFTCHCLFKSKIMRSLDFTKNQSATSKFHFDVCVYVRLALTRTMVFPHRKEMLERMLPLLPVHLAVLLKFNTFSAVVESCSRLNSPESRENTHNTQRPFNMYTELVTC